MYKFLKRVLPFVLAVIIFNANFINLTVKANTVDYLRVLNSSAYVYDTSALTNKIFCVPYGYYVKVENVGSESVRVTYGNDDSDYPVIMGYMYLDDLTTVTTPPTKPFSVIKVSTASSDILFNDSSLKKAYFNVPADTLMYYYGDFTVDNKKLSYVYCNNKLGYIDTACLNPFTIPESPDEIILPTPEVNENESEVTPESNNQTVNVGENLQIIIIVGISVISVSVVYFLFKPSKQNSDAIIEEE